MLLNARHKAWYNVGMTKRRKKTPVAHVSRGLVGQPTEDEEQQLVVVPLVGKVHRLEHVVHKVRQRKQEQKDRARLLALEEEEKANHRQGSSAASSSILQLGSSGDRASSG